MERGRGGEGKQALTLAQQANIVMVLEGPALRRQLSGACAAPRAERRERHTAQPNSPISPAGRGHLVRYSLTGLHSGRDKQRARFWIDVAAVDRRVVGFHCRRPHGPAGIRSRDVIAWTYLMRSSVAVFLHLAVAVRLARSFRGVLWHCTTYSTTCGQSLHVCGSISRLQISWRVRHGPWTSMVVALALCHVQRAGDKAITR